jgi:hypothetical protein
MHPNLMDRRRAATLVAALAAVNLLYAVGIIWHEYAVPAMGGVARNDLPFPDFAAFWAAGVMALEGTPALAYDLAAHKATQASGLGFEFSGLMPWLYPPYFQLLMTPFAAVPLWVGMAAWIAVTLALYLWVCWRILSDPVALLGALAAAPTAIILVNGQTGFLIGGLLGLLLLNLDRQPVRAGIALGLLSIKPQLALALPFALMAAGRWRVLIAASLTLLVSAILAWAVLGAATWIAFFGSITQSADLLSGVTERWDMYGNLYGWERYAGVDFLPAILIHGALALAILGATVAAWRSPRLSPDIKAALLCFAAAAVTPRILNYDLHILVIGVLFQLRHALAHHFYPGEQLLLAAVALAAFVSVLFAPGVTGFLAPALFVGCWFGHGRPSWAGGPGNDASVDPQAPARLGTQPLARAWR